jgi:hypothetical protein
MTCLMTMRIRVDGAVASEQTVVVNDTAVARATVEGHLDVGLLDPTDRHAIAVEVEFDPPLIVEIDTD